MFTLRFRDVVPTSVYDEFQSLVDQLKGFLSVSFNEDGTLIGSNPVLNVVPVGATQGWLTATAPAGWLLLDGSQKNRVTYKGLFDVIGTTFGAGDGSTTFTLPDMRGRFFLGKAAAGTGSVLAEVGGTIDHTHTAGAGNTGATTPAISGSTAGATATISGSTGSTSPGTDSQGSHTHTHSGTTGPATTTQYGTTAGPGDGNGSVHVHNFSGTTDSGGAHSHTVSSHSHSNGSLGVDSHLHGVGTLAVASHTHSLGAGVTGTANPPYLAGNWIVFAGV